LRPVGNAAPPRQQLGLRDRVDDRGGAHLASPLQRGESAVLEVAVDAVRVDHADAAQQARARISTRLGRRRLDRLVHGAEPLGERRRRAVTQPETGRQARTLRLLDPGERAHDVVADVQGDVPAWLEREPGVERNYAVRLRRRDRQPPARVLQRAAAHPARAVLDRVQHRQQQVTPGAQHAAAVGEMMVHRLGRAKQPVDRGHLLGRRGASGRADVH